MQKVTWKAASLILACLMVALSGAGCGDSGGNNCDGVANACEEASATRCNGTDSGIQTCLANLDGCLVWTDSTSCGDNAVCDDTIDPPTCVCVDECTAAGNSQCDGTVINNCLADEVGCLYWVAGTDCAATSETCDDSSGTAQCEGGGCTDDCLVDGETSCVGEVINTCTMQADGCLDWIAGTDCATAGESCDDSAEPAVCVAGCVDECAVDGETECVGDVVNACTAQADGCNDLVAGTDCAAAGETCDDSAEPAVCVAGCTDDCAVDGETECVGEVINDCVVQADGCNDLVAGTDCAAGGEFCDDTAEPAVCSATCVDRCTDGETQCAGDVIQTCAVQASTCTDWNDGTDCAAAGETCDDTAEPAVCVAGCVDECMVDGETACVGEVINTCTMQADGCYDWIAGTDCAAAGETCDDSAEPAVCVAGCTDDCAVDGETECVGEVINACAVQADGCNDLVPGTDCAAAGEFCDDSAEPAVCSATCVDQCTVDGETACVGEVINTCTMQADGCYDWIAGIDCASTGQSCDDSAEPAVCVAGCTDECTVDGETACVGEVINTCVMQADGCYDWIAGIDCAATSETCDDSAEPAVCVGANVCGDGVWDGGVNEVCDGADVQGLACTDLNGFTGGTLLCRADCVQLDLSGCTGGVAGWTCEPAYYGTADGCDCGCGIVDPDCADATVASCEYCGNPGSCNDFGVACPANTDAVDNSQCFVPVCGDGVQEGSELCDGSDLGGLTCIDIGYAGGGTLGCMADCTFDETGCIGADALLCETCTGNGDCAEPGALCIFFDPANMFCGSDCSVNACPTGYTCYDLGTGTDFQCAPTDGDICAQCTPTSCPTLCGNGTIDTGEDCDGSDLNGQDCIALGYTGGTLACGVDCLYDTTACTGSLCDPVTEWECLDGQCIPVNWLCDGFDDCSAAEDEDPANCPVCGDGTIEGAEDCEGSDLNGQDCIGLGYTGGTLACAADCSFDVSGCTGSLCDPVTEWECLDGQCIPAGWLCDGINDCSANEDEDPANCPSCGDGVAEGTEECDGADLRGLTCIDLGYTGGTLACDAACALDRTGCTGAPACTDLASAVGMGVATGTNAGMFDMTQPSCAGGTGGLEVCFTWLAPTTDTYQVDTDGSDYDTTLYVYDSLGVEIACDDDGGASVQSLLFLDAVASETYTIVVDGYSSASVGDYILNIGFGPVCGDGVMGGTEECDGADLGGATCADYGFLAGTLACAVDCTVDTSGCTGGCIPNVPADQLEAADLTNDGVSWDWATWVLGPGTPEATGAVFAPGTIYTIEGDCPDNGNAVAGNDYMDVDSFVITAGSAADIHLLLDSAGTGADLDVIITDMAGVYIAGPGAIGNGSADVLDGVFEEDFYATDNGTFVPGADYIVTVGVYIGSTTLPAAWQLTMCGQ